MARSFKEALEKRRSYYSISNESPISNEQIKSILRTAVTHVPSAFNSQSTRIVLLLAHNHKRFWTLVKNRLKAIVPAAAFPETEAKIDNCFAAGYGTILFLEDTTVVEHLQNSFPLYKDNFPIWSQHTSAMHQLAIWTMLEDEGFGASLQHYNPLVDADICQEWGIHPSWKLVAQMPFGKPISNPQEKTYKPLEERILVFE
ncbi:MAG: nitroreductase family protein [Phocaeicola sp.]